LPPLRLRTTDKNASQSRLINNQLQLTDDALQHLITIKKFKMQTTNMHRISHCAPKSV